MSTITSTVNVNASLDTAWEAISNVGRVENWHPGVKRSPVLTPEPTGMGAQRRCDMFDGTSVVETITALKDREMVQVELTEFPMPFRQASILLRLHELGPKQVEIKLEFDFDVNDGMDAETLKPTMNQTIAHILEGLDQHLITGERIDDPTPETQKTPDNARSESPTQ